MEGPQWTTGSIGRRCKPGNGLSRPVLIGRHEPPPHTPPHRRGAGRTRRVHYAAQDQPTHPPRGAGPPRTTTTPPPSRRPQRGRETPGPIPNPEAKPPSADGTAPTRERKSRTPPGNTPPNGPAVPPRGRRGHNHPTPHGDDGATTIPQARPGRDTLEPAPPHRPPRPQQPRNETLHGPQQARAGLPRSIGIVPSRLRTSREGAPGGLGLLRRPPLLARRRAGAPPQGRRSPSCGAGARRGPRMAR